MRNVDAEVVLRVLEGLRRQTQATVHPRTAPMPEDIMVVEAISLVRAEIASNYRRGEAKKRT